MRLIGLVLGAALAGALPAAAQPAAPPGTNAPTPNPGGPALLTVTPPSPELMARRMARRAARVDRDIQTLHAGLQLTPAQDALWPAVAEAIHAVDTARGFRFRQAMEAAPSQVDGLKLQGEHMAAMGQAIGKLASATKPLVATLSPDQKSRLPGLLQGVRLPKVMSRALDLPQDTAESWGIGSVGGGPGGQGPRGQGRLERGPAGQGGGPDRAWGIGQQGQAGSARPDAAPDAAPGAPVKDGAAAAGHPAGAATGGASNDAGDDGAGDE